MMLSLKKDVCFLALPKCASTSIESVLLKHCDIVMQGPPQFKHMNAKAYHRHILPLLHGKRPETFCLFREPIDWLGSWYRYRARPEMQSPKSKQKKHKKYTGNMTFNDFVVEVLEGREQLRPSNFVMLGQEKGCGVDRIFRMENIDAVEQYLSEKLSEKVSLPRMNASPPMELKIDPAVKKGIEEHYKADYELYYSLA